MGLVNHTYHSSHISPPIIRTPLYPPPLGALPIVPLIRADWVRSWGPILSLTPRPHTKWERIGVVSPIRAPMWPHTGNILGMPPSPQHGPLCPLYRAHDKSLTLAPYQVHYQCPLYKAPSRPIEAICGELRQRYQYRVTRSAGAHTESPAGIPEQEPSMSLYRYLNRTSILLSVRLLMEVLTLAPYIGQVRIGQLTVPQAF